LNSRFGVLPVEGPCRALRKGCGFSRLNKKRYYDKGSRRVHPDSAIPRLPVTMPPFPVLLIRPPYPLGRLAFINTQIPLNLCSLAGCLRAEGFPDTRILDFEVTPYDREAFRNRLAGIRPGLIGFTACTPTVDLAARIASDAREALPSVFRVAGGPHVSALPGETLEAYPVLDAVAVGEGEETLVELAGVLARGGRDLAGVKGLVWRDGGRLHVNEPREPVRDLDSLPFPARDLLDLGAYRGQVFRGFSRDYLRIGELITSRGCPNRCVFCASKVVLGRRVRFRSAANVLREVRECMDRYGMRHFVVLDDTINLDHPRLFELCQGFQRLGISWNCLATVSHMTPEVLQAMKRSGCTGITFGVESGSPRILRKNGKNITREQAVAAFRWAREAGIRTLEADFMIGSHPSETAEDLERSRQLVRELNPDILSVQPLIPYPGTQAHRILADKGLLGNMRWQDFVFFGTTPTWRLEHLDGRDMIRWQRRMLRDFYFRPSNLLRRLRKITGLREFLYYLKVGLQVFRKV